MLIDRFGRVHTSLRISVTDRCNLRCVYCMPAENVTFLPRPALLTFEEIVRVVRVARGLGVNKLRLTGGEPLLRRDLPELVRQLAEIPGMTLGLTTNGMFLDTLAGPLYAAGLRSLNVSLDTLDGERFQELARRDGLDRVLTGIEAAQGAGFESIKVNAVAMRQVTEADVVPFGEFARRTGIEVRFIEYMPLDADQAWEREKVLLADEIREMMSAGICPLVECPTDGHAPATRYQFADGVGTIGFIPSVSQPFCGQCNRFRLTSDGKLRACLFSLEETDVRGILRSGGTDEEIAQAMRTCIAGKWEGHEINTARFLYPDRPMYSIGG